MSETPKAEIVYILDNEAMPGIIKIGRTTDLMTRITQLSASASLPCAFRCVYAAVVDDAVLVERQLHRAFSQHRMRGEFFQLQAYCAISILELVAKEIVTPAKRRPEEVPTNNNIVTITKSLYRVPANEREKSAVIDALTKINRPVSNEELASLMRISTGEASKRVSALRDLVKRERTGRQVTISLRSWGLSHTPSDADDPPLTEPETAEQSGT